MYSLFLFLLLREFGSIITFLLSHSLSFFVSLFKHAYFAVSPGHNQNWIYDFLSSDWLTENQNIVYTAKGLRSRRMAAMSRRKPLQRYSSYDGILLIYRSLDFYNLWKTPSKSRFLYFSLLELRDSQKLEL